MRKCSFKSIRLLAVLLALLLVALSLPVVPAQAAPKASETSADDDDISVLSLIVNTNSETNEVFTELILQNKGGEDKQITFPLPEVYAGINTKTLTVRTANGEDLVHDSGTVTLDLQAGDFAGVSFTYKTKKNLVYEHLIGFDLKQLSAVFSDRIGHLEWTVDIPLYELILVDDIQPVNFTCDGKQIRVELDNFLVSRLLDKVYLDRTTHKDLLEKIENTDEEIEEEYERLQDIPNELAPLEKEYEELEARIDQVIDWENGWDSMDPEQQNYISGLQDQSGELSVRIDDLIDEEYNLKHAIANQIVNKFVIENYREWYKNPEEIQSHLDPFSRGYTLVDMYLDRYYSQKDRERILGQLKSRYWLGDYSSELLEIFNNMTEYPDDDEGLYQNMLWGMGFFDLEYPYWYSFRPAVQAMYYGDDHSVYAIIPSGPKTDRSMVIVWSDDFGDSSEKFVSGINEYIIQRMEIDYMTSSRFAITSESEFEDIETVSDYLDALHVKAILRAELPEDDFFVKANFQDPFFTSTLIGYDGTKEWPYESFKADFDSVESDWRLLDQYNWSMKSLVDSGEGVPEDYRNVKEPLKDTFRLPIMTMYLGHISGESETKENIRYIEYYRGEAMFEDEGAINKFLDLPTPKSMIDSHYRDVELAIKENDRLIAQAYEKLNLPDLPEGVRDQPETEAPTEEATTEAPTEEATVPSTEAVTEAPVETTGESITEASTAAVDDETETFASKDTKDPSDKGILILLIAIGAGIVVAGAATTAVFIKKKSKKKG
ncbi:MAG: hypothetical protein J6T47_08735 [Lachnospiraceae bacterium]|nr:hypothetical protein [Lachnospiraceae bacterium]